MIANCRTTVDLLAEVVEGTTTAEEEAAVRTHLRICRRCVEILETYRAVPRIFRAATDVPAPPDLEGRLLDFLSRAR